VKKYQIIYADPPWEYNAWGRADLISRPATELYPADKKYPIPYPTMKLEEIKALPVGILADTNCELYLWTTQHYLPFAFSVIQSWGFKYCQTITWCKTPRGLGQGGIFCPTTEFLLLARKGKMPRVKRLGSTWYLTKRPHNSHSTKPEFFRELIERVSNPPRIELFARRKVEGWDCWGNEVESDIVLPNGEGE